MADPISIHAARIRRDPIWQVLASFAEAPETFNDTALAQRICVATDGPVLWEPTPEGLGDD